MFRTVYKIRKMDCPSEEHVIRMKPGGLPGYGCSGICNFAKGAFKILKLSK